MSVAQLPSVTSGAESHVGSVRKHNEDAFGGDPGRGLWVVADGMGGAAAGEVASMLAVAGIEARTARGEGLVQAMQGAHRAILAAPAEGRGKAGMGSTVVALRLDPDSYEIAWVGDSRAYLLRDGELIQLTRDHSLVQELVDRGDITPLEARSHPQRNIITQALGGLGIASPSPDAVSGKLNSGDLFVLCTDGLNGEVDDAGIRDILCRTGDPQQAAAQLVRAALAAGGRDNITAVVIAVGRVP